MDWREEEAREIAQEIRSMDTWDMELLKKLCALANMEEEWEQADGETFEEVANKAAETLGVELY
mgnify:FL=1